MNKTILTVALLCLSTFLSFSQTAPLPYKNPGLPIETRVDDLLSRMSLEQKFWQLFMIPGNLDTLKERYRNGVFGFQFEGGYDFKNSKKDKHFNHAREMALKFNAIQKYFIEVSDLGIPIIPFDEALHGLIHEGATCFPQAIGLAATFDTALMHQVAGAIAIETRSRGLRQILSPVVNIASDVRWGRTEETYGEDPFLSSEMGVAFVSEFEKRGVITTPKHFVANHGDGGRDSYPVNFNERLLDEVYLPPFKACFLRGASTSVMTSYNSLDGSPCTASDWLMNKKLKKEWNFKGFIISDACAVGGANVLHMTAKDYTEATENAMNNGLDVILQTEYDHYKLFLPGFQSGKIPMKTIDDAVKRVLWAKFRLGLFENPYVDPEEAARQNGSMENLELARKAAREAIVLLKNENKTLPLQKNLKAVAVIGIDATEARMGGYSGPAERKQSILEGIKAKLGSAAKVTYIPGCGRENIQNNVISPEYLYCIENGKQTKGLKAEYFNTTDLSGSPVLTRVDPEIQFRWTLYPPDPKINFDWYSVRWTGKLKAPATGVYKIGFEGNDGYRLFIDNKLIIDNWKKQSFNTRLVDFSFQEGKEYDIRVEYFETIGYVWFKMIWNYGVKDPSEELIDKAVEAARASDVAIVVAGIEEGESRDRAFLNLPGRQEEMIRRVAATGKPVVVILVAGSAVTMSNWLDKVPAVLDVWYPGEQGGYAIADVLFGDYNPAGRLPITFPLAEGQLPLYYYHKPTGRIDDYLDLSGEPLFPFGFGLSYTSFDYNDLQMSKTSIKSGETTTISFKVKNTGDRDGDEVVQLYVKDVLASVARPVRELKGFQRISLKAGESREVTFQVTLEMLSMLDKDLKTVEEPGEFILYIGASSRDFRLRTVLNVLK